MKPMLASLLILSTLALPALAQDALVKQNSIPEASKAWTRALRFDGPVVDCGVTLEIFRQQGEGVEWSPDGQWVAYDCKHRNGYYNVHVCRPDGTGDHCLTTLDNGLPHRHAGTATWDPAGGYLVFAAEKRVHQGGSIEAIPGFGGRSDLWAMTTDGSKAWQLTDTADVKTDGVIIPKFSHDGRQVAWVERVGMSKWAEPRSWLCKWVIKAADFDTSTGVPRFTNIRTYRPGPPGFYECYGFSPDDRRIIFCSDRDRPTALNSQIYVIDAVDGGNLRCLTNNRAYNEHASYSPDGRHIIWMTNDGNKSGTDWWIMRADGSNKRRLTHFNQPGYQESSPTPVWACLTNWSPDGRHILGGVQYSLIRQEGRIVMMTLDDTVLAD